MCDRCGNAHDPNDTVFFMNDNPRRPMRRRMEPAQAVIRKLRSRGVHIGLCEHGCCLELSPYGDLTEQDRERFGTYFEELVELLRVERSMRAERTSGKIEARQMSQSRID